MKRKQICNGLCVSLCCLLTACMGDGSDSVNYHRVGVVKAEPMKCIHTTDAAGNIYVISSPDFEARDDVRAGDCCLVDFKTGFSEELTAGVYKAEIYMYDSVTVWPLREELTDTSRVLDRERLVTVDFKKALCLEDHLFLQTQHTSHQTDQRDLYDLSYDPSKRAETNEEGEPVYDLYLRVQKEGGSGEATRWVQTTAFTIDHFLSQVEMSERASGKSRLHFRINYPTAFNADTTACVWGVTDLLTLRFTN